MKWPDTDKGKQSIDNLQRCRCMKCQLLVEVPVAGRKFSETKVKQKVLGWKTHIGAIGSTKR